MCKSTLGVPQGSILGPALFNNYINDLFGVPDYCSLESYADDSELHPSVFVSADRLARLVEHRITVRQVGGSNTRRTELRAFGLVRRKCCLCKYICKWFDSLVFLDENDKPNAPSCNSSVLTALRDVKEPTHRSKRVEHGVPGFVAGLHLSRGLGVYYCYSVPVKICRRLIKVNR